MQQRTTAPTPQDKWWQTSFNPCIPISHGTVLPNCFSGDTKIVTFGMIEELQKLVNNTLLILTIDGWKKAEIKHFGKQRLYEVTLRNGHKYKCTANHRWAIWQNDKAYTFIETKDLSKGMRIRYTTKQPIYRSYYENPKYETVWTEVSKIVDTETIDDVYCPVEPITHTCTLGGGELTGQCVGYAWGRYAEILGKRPTGLPTCNAGDWIDRLPSSFKHGMTPKLGAVGVWKYPGQPGHVAVVEAIYSDGRIKLSESGYGNSWAKRWWTSIQSGPNYYQKPYKLQGFVYNPGVDSGTATQPNGDHPALKYVEEALKHVGPGGRAWVQSKTSIGNGAWCAATCCAVGIVTGMAGVIMPKAEYWAAGFGRDVVEKYGGQYIPGPQMGGRDVRPQAGDFIILTRPNKGGTYLAGTKYAGYHIGIVRGVEGNKILTVEGNTHGGQYLKCEHHINGNEIGWYARPNWTKVGGTMGVDGSPGSPNIGGDLYKTKSTRDDASLREVCYMSTLTAKPQIDQSPIRLSAINYTGLLGAFVKAFGRSNNGGDDNSPSAPGDTSQAQGQIKTQSGRVIQTGSAVDIPASVNQSGIIANYTSYTQFFGRWARGTNQRKLSEIWASQGKPSKYYVATISGYYLIALSPRFGRCGDIVSVVLEDNSYFNAIIGDEKGRDAQSSWGHILGGKVDIVEWEANGRDQSLLRSGLRQAGWLGKRVKKIINYGTYFQ